MLLKLFFFLDYPGQPMRFVQGFRDEVLNGETYSPSGGVLRPGGPIKETADTTAQRLDVFLVGRPDPDSQTAASTGIDDATLMQLSDPKVRGREGMMTLGMFDPEMGVLIAAETLFSGYVDTTRLDLTLGMGVLSLITWEGLSRQSFGFNVTHQHQQTIHPGDPSLEYAFHDYVVLADRVPTKD